jgi:hypothetical protein
MLDFGETVFDGLAPHDRTAGLAPGNVAAVVHLRFDRIQMRVAIRVRRSERCRLQLTLVFPETLDNQANRHNEQTTIRSNSNTDSRSTLAGAKNIGEYPQ